MSGIEDPIAYEPLTVPAGKAVSRLPRMLDRGVDWAVVFFGGWTVAYHLALLVGASRDGAFVFGLGLAAVAIGLLPSPPEPEVELTPGAVVVEPGWELPARLAGVGLVAVLAAAGSSLFWPAAFLLSIWLLRAMPRSTRWRDHRGDRPLAAAWVLLLAVVAAYLSASVIRWTTDDTYYVNRALVISESSGPMPYRVDTMHSPGTFPSAEPDNDLTSWHPLAGLGADFAGISARGFISLIAQPLVAALAVLAIWRAAGVLGARRPAAATTLVLILCLLLAGSGRSVWFNMWASNSGRAMLATAILPLVLVYAVEAARRPGWGSAIRVALVCIGAGGASLSAAFVLPPVIGAGVLAARSKPLAREMRVVWAGAVVGVAYAGVLAGIGILSIRGRPPGDSVVASVVDQWTAGAIGVGAAPSVVGLVTGLIFLALVMGSAVARRLAVFIFILGLGFVVSPLALVYGGKGSTTVFRGAWALVPMVLAAIALDGLLRRLPGWLPVTALFVVVGMIGTPLGDLGRNPGSDLPNRATTIVARRLIAVAPAGSTVVARVPVLGVVPVLTTQVYPLVALRRYGETIDALDSEFQYEDRMAVIVALNTGFFDGPPERLAELFGEFGIGAVALGAGARAQGWIASMLTDLGFEERRTVRGLTIWSR